MPKLLKHWNPARLPQVIWSVSWMFYPAAPCRLSPLWQWAFTRTLPHRLSFNCSARLFRRSSGKWRMIRAQAKNGWKSGRWFWPSRWRFYRLSAKSAFLTKSFPARRCFGITAGAEVTFCRLLPTSAQWLRERWLRFGWVRLFRNTASNSKACP